MILVGDDAIVVVMGSRDSDSHHDELIERLQAEAAAAIDGPMVVYESDALTPQVQEQFWREVVAFENAGTTDLIKELTAIGVALPEPHGLDDAAIHDALWKVIEALTKLSVFLHFTDHLSDRELYIHLLREILPEEMASLDTEENSAWHIDVLGGNQQELYLKYYASGRERDFWARDFPDQTMPVHEDPPYDRDRHLPRPRWMQG